MAIDITQIVEPARQALSPIGNSLSEGWSAVIGDRIAAWRLKNAAALQTAVNEEVSKLGLKLDRSKIPERYAFAWFEEATKQDETEIQELFARLLARAAAGDEDALDRRHLEIVSKFTPMEAKVLQQVFELGLRAPKFRFSNGSAVWAILRNQEGDRATIALEHLITLGVPEREYSLKHGDYFEPDRYSVEEELSVSSTGLSLCRVLDILPA